MNALTVWSAGWPYNFLDDGTPVWQDETPLAQGGQGNRALGEAVAENIAEIYSNLLGRLPASDELATWTEAFWDGNYYNESTGFDAIRRFNEIATAIDASIKASDEFKNQNAQDSFPVIPLILLLGGVWYINKRK